MKLAAIRAERVTYSISRRCRVLHGFRRGYWTWLERQPGPRSFDEADLAVRLGGLHGEHRGRERATDWLEARDHDVPEVVYVSPA